jgi:hypothetical protein
MAGLRRGPTVGGITERDAAVTAAAIPEERALRDSPEACIADERQELDDTQFAQTVTAVAGVFGAFEQRHGGRVAGEVVASDSDVMRGSLRRPDESAQTLGERPVVLTARTAIDTTQGGSMDFSAQLDELQQRVTAAKSAAQAAATESRDQLRQRIDQAQLDVNLAVNDAQQQAGEAAASARSKWAQMKADAAAKMDNVQSKIDKRAQQLDARAAASDADWAEDDAASAIDYAEWTVDNARLAVLDAIDARAYADERARAAGS